MLAVFLSLAQALENLLVRRRNLILDELFRGQAGVPCGFSQDAMEILLNFPPAVFIHEFAGARSEQILRRASVSSRSYQASISC